MTDKNIVSLQNRMLNKSTVRQDELFLQKIESLYFFENVMLLLLPALVTSSKALHSNILLLLSVK